MRYVFLILLVLAPTQATSQARTAFINGRWFNGSRFEARTVYTVDGRFQFARPAQIDTTIDLAGGYVVPPFAEAHNHNIEASSQLQTRIDRYLREGIFYIKNPNVLPRGRASLAGQVNTPSTPDVLFANGGLNATRGHPYDLVQRNIARGTWTEVDAEGAFYHSIDDRTALDAKWPGILAGRPDFIKTYLLYSDEYEKRRNDTTYRGNKGLDPKLLPEIARRAHAAGLTVTTHIETAADFRNAIAADVDEVAHMPGYAYTGGADSAQYQITRDDARAAARGRLTVVTTLAVARRTGPNGEMTDRERARNALHTRNLTLLKDAGVQVIIGSDNYGATAASEVMYLNSLGVYTAAELLRMWSETTPRALFPARRIGRLQDGYEASLLVLEADPLADFGATTRIRLRMKQGTLIRQ